MVSGVNFKEEKKRIDSSLCLPAAGLQESTAIDGVPPTGV
jgi:hypothetical protein